MLLQHQLIFYGIMAFIFFPHLVDQAIGSHVSSCLLIIICEMLIFHLILAYMITCSLRMAVSLIFCIFHLDIRGQSGNTLASHL